MPDSKDTGKKTAAKKKAVKKTAKKKATKKAVKKKTTRVPAAEADQPAAETKVAAAPARKKTRAAAASAGRLRVKQVRSTIHRPKTFKRTLVALGLKHHQDEVVIADTPSARGMLQKVRHLISVRAEES